MQLYSVFERSGMLHHECNNAAFVGEWNEKKKKKRVVIET